VGYNSRSQHLDIRLGVNLSQARRKKSDILDDDLVHILNGLPVEYKVQVSKLEECFGSASNLLTIQDMHGKLSLKFAQLKCQAAEQSETNQALAAFHRYKGKCTNCGEFRHKSTKYHSRTRNSKEEGANSSKDKSKSYR